MQYFILIPHKKWGFVCKANAKIENLRIALDMVLQCGIIQMSQGITFVFYVSLRRLMEQDIKTKIAFWYYSCGLTQEEIDTYFRRWRS
jgi:hypothetical protein